MIAIGFEDEGIAFEDFDHLWMSDVGRSSAGHMDAKRTKEFRFNVT
jgi:hypothetical protein